MERNASHTGAVLNAGAPSANESRYTHTSSQRGSRIIKNWLLALVAFALSLGAAELVLRWWVEPSRIYSSLRELPAANAWKNRVRYWERYHERGTSGLAHDPMLGWDHDIAGDRIRGNATYAAPPQDDSGTRIVAIGDSYTYGNEVEAHENFAALLDAQSGVQVLNMGVPGYGVGQAFLKWREHGRQYRPDVVVFGIYVDDYERASVTFSSAAKPRLVLRNGEIAVEGQPVPTPAEALTRIAAELDERVRVVDAVRNILLKARTGAEARETYFTEMDAVVRAMLQSLLASLNDAQRLLVVHIPRAEAFVKPDPFRTEMSARLTSIYTQLGIDHIDLGEEFLRGRSARDAFMDLYVHRPSGSVGHLSPAGHQVVADLVASRLTLTSSR